jgi:hypothetical protein
MLDVVPGIRAVTAAQMIAAGRPAYRCCVSPLWQLSRYAPRDLLKSGG